MFFFECYEGLLDRPERIVALGRAVVFGLLALMVAAGTLATRFGNYSLNVEDPYELAEERPNLMIGSLSFALIYKSCIARFETFRTVSYNFFASNSAPRCSILSSSKI